MYSGAIFAESIAMSSEYVNLVMVDAAATAYRPVTKRGVGLFGIVLGTGYVGVPPFVERFLSWIC